MTLPELRAAPIRRVTLLRLLTCLLLIAATIHVAHQYARMRMALSGDEYYFYYAATASFVDTPSDPLWTMRARLDRAAGELSQLAATSPQCRQATEGARRDLGELIFLLDSEGSGPGYGPLTAFQGVLLRAWDSLRPYSTEAAVDAQYPARLGERIAFTIALPLVLLIVFCFAVPAFTRSVCILCATGVYVLLHSLLPSSTEPYWTYAQQDLASAWWILRNAVGQPFLHPGYADSMLTLAPRGHVVIPFLLALAFRWSGKLRWSYVLAASLPLLHWAIGSMIFAILLAVDLVARPRIFADRVLLVLIAAAATAAWAAGAGALLLRLAGGWSGAGAAVALVAALTLHARYLARTPCMQRLSIWSERNPIALDLIASGPVFWLLWTAVAVGHVHAPVATDYGLINLAMKSAVVTHHFFFFGLFCLGFTALVRMLEPRLGTATTAHSVLLATSAVALAAFIAAPPVPANWPSLPRKYSLMAQQQDELARRPLKIGASETHLMWHRIVRQRETGGTWVEQAVDVAPLKAACGLAGTGAAAGAHDMHLAR